MASSYPWLPFELLIKILNEMDLDDSGAVALARCSQAGKALRQVALDTAIWEPYYHVRYTIHDAVKEAARHAKLETDWHSLYACRRRLDVRALKLIDKIVRSVLPQERIEYAREIVDELGPDVWNAIEGESVLPLSAVLMGEVRGPKPNLDYRKSDLSHRFWAKEMLGLIARLHATKRWSQLRPQLNAADYPQFEEVLAGLSAFWGVHPEQV